MATVRTGDTPALIVANLRAGVPEDALCLGMLATQVFLDTYATQGIGRDLAQEADSLYSAAAMAARLADANVEIIVAESGGRMAGFLDLSLRSSCPVAGIAGPEVCRLYIQAPFQRQGLGRRLLARAEARASASASSNVWLTAWSGNAGALAFYPAAGYVDVGATDYVIQGTRYENRVFAKTLRPGVGALR